MAITCNPPHPAAVTVDRVLAHLPRLFLGLFERASEQACPQAAEAEGDSSRLRAEAAAQCKAQSHDPEIVT